MDPVTITYGMAVIREEGLRAQHRGISSRVTEALNNSRRFRIHCVQSETRDLPTGRIGLLTRVSISRTDNSPLSQADYVMIDSIVIGAWKAECRANWSTTEIRQRISATGSGRENPLRGAFRWNSPANFSRDVTAGSDCSTSAVQGAMGANVVSGETPGERREAATVTQTISTLSSTAPSLGLFDDNPVARNLLIAGAVVVGVTAASAVAYFSIRHLINKVIR